MTAMARGDFSFFHGWFRPVFFVNISDLRLRLVTLLAAIPTKISQASITKIRINSLEDLRVVSHIAHVS